jgi:formate/nitrite transporter FocA (FNT family)
MGKKHSDNDSPKKDSAQPNDGPVTERGIERGAEDEDFVPVIIKRTDESVRHPDDVLENAISHGLEQLNRSSVSLILSSFGAGLILGFTVMAVAVMATLTEPLQDPFLLRISMALVYPLGFIVCIMVGTQLFTEHTATAVYPVLSGKAGLKRLGRLWAYVLLGNLLGAAASAGLLDLAEEVILAHEGYIHLGRHLVGFSAQPLFFSSMLAGWLMALGGWLVLVTSPALSQMMCIYAVTFLIGLGGLHHSIAGACELFVYIFVGDEATLFESLRFLVIAIAGNLIGGSVFVAGFNYTHIRKTQEIENGSKES